MMINVNEDDELVQRSGREAIRPLCKLAPVGDDEIEDEDDGFGWCGKAGDPRVTLLLAGDEEEGGRW